MALASRLRALVIRTAAPACYRAPPTRRRLRVGDTESSTRMRGFGKYWGWVVFAVLVAGWLTLDFGPVVLVVLSGVSAFYFFFNVPVWCGAAGRGGACRHNSHGVLMGCHLRQHKWQKLKMIFWTARWARLRQELFQNATTTLASLSGILAVTSGVASTLQPLFGGGW